jgi:hypothetical protein
VQYLGSGIWEEKCFIRIRNTGMLNMLTARPLRRFMRTTTIRKRKQRKKM